TVIGANDTVEFDDADDPDAVTLLSILIVGIFLSLLIFVSAAGNILVCIAIYTDRGLRRIGNLFLASYWVFGEQFCDTWVACDVMCSTASILNLCAISLDRYIHIKDPLSFLPISLGLHRPPDEVLNTTDKPRYPTCALVLTPTQQNQVCPDQSTYSCSFVTIPHLAFKILTWLGYSNSAFNPIIYSIFNTEFREAFKKILTSKYPLCCGYKSVRAHTPTRNDNFVTDYGTKTLVVRRSGSLGLSGVDPTPRSSAESVRPLRDYHI
ncbi:unnamed protein product, partial [Leptidea sinapis]